MEQLSQAIVFSILKFGIGKLTGKELPVLYDGIKQSKWDRRNSLVRKNDLVKTEVSGGRFQPLLTGTPYQGKVLPYKFCFRRLATYIYTYQILISHIGTLI